MEPLDRRRRKTLFRNEATGLEKKGEKIKLKLVPPTELRWEGARDPKFLAALSLYKTLKREGKLPSMPNNIDREVKKGVSGGGVQKAAAISTL